jgi:hypothetical protein
MQNRIVIIMIAMTSKFMSEQINSGNINFRLRDQGADSWLCQEIPDILRVERVKK